MTDQGVSKEVQQQFITVISLKDIADPTKKFLKKGKRRDLKFRAKVASLHQGNSGQLADSTGLINFIIENNAATVTQGQTYEFTGSLRVVNYKLTLNINTATASAEPITEQGKEFFSAADIDQNSGKSIITVAGIITTRIGQSFFAKALNIEHLDESKKVKAVLADSTAAVDVEISVNKKNITQEVLQSLSSDKVYLFSDMVLSFNESNKLVGRFNYRSSITEAPHHEIKNISNNNVSAKAYEGEEKQTLTTILQISERKERPNKQNKKRKTKNVKKEVKKPTFNNPNPVKVNELEQWNNNQSFVGKILSLNVEAKAQQPREGETEPKQKFYLKGQVGDSTGVVDFDMAEKRDVPRFKVGDVVKFTTVMNKGRASTEGKVGGHYIEIKKFGSYQVVDEVIEKVDTNNNLSTKELTARPKNPNPRFIKGELTHIQKDEKGFTYTVTNAEGQQSLTLRNELKNAKVGETITIHRNRNRSNIRQNNQGNRSNSTNQRQNNRNSSNNRNPSQQNNYNNKQHNNRDNSRNNNNRDGNRSGNRDNNNRDNNNRDNNNRDGNRGRRVNSQNQGQRQYNNNNNNNNNNTNNGNNNNQRYRNNSFPRQNKPDHFQYVPIINLKPGERGQNFTGQVVDCETFSKEINGKTLNFVKGRVADNTANIRFDIKLPNNFEVKVGQVYNFQNVFNKVDDKGYHFVDLNRFGKIYNSKKTFDSINTSRNNETDRSSIEYVKKTISN